MKRIWFTQQQPFNFMPLRAGLGYITEDELKRTNKILLQQPTWLKAPLIPAELCHKIYTTRKNRLKGEYYVVEGSRFKAKPVEPRIEFKVEKSWQMDLRTERVLTETNIGMEYYDCNDILRKLHISFPELDLGYKGATFEDLKKVLFNYNKGATLDTPFFINRLEPIGETT